MTLEELRLSYTSLDLQRPSFIHEDITIREISLNADFEIVEYLDRLDELWITTVFTMFHDEIVDNLWEEHSLEMLVNRDFTQTAYNFLISATIGWCKQAIVPLNRLLNSGTLVVKEEPCQVLPFVRH